jgi:hypothetical protein
MNYASLYLWRFLQLSWCTAVFSILFIFGSQIFASATQIGVTCDHDLCVANLVLIVFITCLLFGYIFIFPPWINQAFIERVFSGLVRKILTALNIAYLLVWGALLFFIILGMSLAMLVGTVYIAQIWLYHLDLPFSTEEKKAILIFILGLNFAFIFFWTRNGNFEAFKARVADLLLEDVWRSCWPEEFSKSFEVYISRFQIKKR